MPFCPRCGARVEEGDAYCWNCGLPLDVIYMLRRRPVAPPPNLTSAIKEAYLSLFRPSPHIMYPTEAVYEKIPEYTPIKKYLIIGIVFVVVGLTLTTFGTWIRRLGFTLAAFTSPLLLLFWMYRNDRYEQEPISLVAFTFGWGVISTFIALLINTYMGWPAPFAALSEEPAKAIGLYWLARHKTLGKEFNDHLDGMVYGAAVGAGFAGTENILYIAHFAPLVGALTIILIRSLSPITHIICTALVGRSLGLAKVRKGEIHPTDIIPGLLVAMTLHALWNAANILSLTVLFPLYIASFAKLIREARRDELLWGYARGLAPKEQK
ncbi:MAG TPA: PrsW family intramembrane metalloprotease [Candidatus Bathyarchaeota archaeon]|nr:PrsW family intramembrane metalloprotease [Candidatus Bathyarchaeota archaeon]